MSQEAVEKLLGRLITDDDFRESASAAFPQVCFEEGFDLTDAERKIVQSIDFKNLAFLAGRLDKRIKRSRKTLFSGSGPVSGYGIGPVKGMDGQACSY